MHTADWHNSRPPPLTVSQPEVGLHQGKGSTTLLPVYEFRFLVSMQSFQCLFPVCPSKSHSSSGLHNHSRRLHYGAIILILEDHQTPFPHSQLCDQQVPPWPINNCHYNSKACFWGYECRLQQEALHRCFEANRIVIRVNLEPLEATTASYYIGRTIRWNNSDWTEFYINLRKYHRIWEMVAKVMGKTGRQ